MLQSKDNQCHAQLPTPELAVVPGCKQMQHEPEPGPCNLKSFQEEWEEIKWRQLRNYISHEHIKIVSCQPPAT
jgi:hypothetical protein